MSAGLHHLSAAHVAGALPVVACFLALSLTAAFAPTLPSSQSPSASSGTHPRMATGNGESYGVSGGQVSTAPAGGATSAGVGAGPAGSTGAVVPGSAGTTVSGVGCAPGVRQFSWSVYAPECVPAFHGANGGATSHGVTASTITLSYRMPNSAQQAAINALAGAANVDDPSYIADMETYIHYFNSQYELYGRQVVLRPYQGQGDYIEEDQGQNLAGAQSDAATAAGLGAFGDNTFPLYSSQPYYQDLASEGVIGFGAPYLPQSWFDQYAPYEYSVFSPSGTTAAAAVVNGICRRFAGMPAVFSGQSDFQHETRRFGLITPDNPVYVDVGNTIEQGISHCGVSLASRVSYTINVADFGSQATTIVAKMKAAGVTSVICGCDPLMPIFLSRDADQQSYFPEWLSTFWGDPATRNFSQDQWSHDLAVGYQFPPPAQEEAYRTFLAASGGRPPAEQYYYVVYYSLLPLFGAIQGAGPDLTPASFEKGWFSLPGAMPGDAVAGGWQFGSGSFDPVVGLHEVWWDPTAASFQDGRQGAYQWCNGGQEFVATDPSTFGSGQAACFGR